jgi:predicted RNase H-like nuclease (RuvC/YqgF family)
MRRLQELDSMRMHSQIWADNNSSEVEKLKSESSLMQNQLAEQSAELTMLRQQLLQAEADRDAAVREKQQVKLCRFLAVGQMKHKKQQ